MLCLAPSCLNLLAQTRTQPPVPQSELGRQNMAHVSASVGQLIAVLHRDPGLMVELKRWLAKDATDHGQIISDSDLTDEAIFDRLENDIPFRSVATVLVQKYGYLQPAVNPESPLAKEQELLAQERVKWQVQDEEAARARARQLQEQELNQTQFCDPRERKLHYSEQQRQQSFDTATAWNEYVSERRSRSSEPFDHPPNRALCTAHTARQ